MSSFLPQFLVLIGKSKILNQIVKMLKFRIVPAYKGISIVETIEHFMLGKMDNIKSKTLEYKGMLHNSM